VITCNDDGNSRIFDTENNVKPILVTGNMARENFKFKLHTEIEPSIYFHDLELFPDLMEEQGGGSSKYFAMQSHFCELNLNLSLL